MIITDSQIRKLCMLGTTYGKGQNLYNQNYVHDLYAEKYAEDTVFFDAVVDGKVTSSYDTFIEMNVNLKQNTMHMSGYECNCPAFGSYDGFCKHLVATAMKINDLIDFEMIMEIVEKSDVGDVYSFKEKKTDERKKIADYYQESLFESSESGDISIRSTSSGRTFISPGKIKPKFTSPELMSAMKGIRQQERTGFCRKMADGDVELEVTLHLEPDEEKIELKIGKGKMYVVKNIPELADNIRNESYKSYGKNLSIVHHQSSFSKLSQDVIALLLDKYSEPEDEYEAYIYRYTTTAAEKRYLSLDVNSLDRLMEIYAGKQLYVENSLTYGRYLTPVKCENPRLPAYISGKKDEGIAKIKLPGIILLEGNHTYYIWWQNAIYICTEEYCRDMQELLKIMAINTLRAKRPKNLYGYYRDYLFKPQNIAMELSEEDYAVFSGTVLPIIEKYMDLHIKDADFSKYRAEEGLYEIYLDINKNQDVVCKAQGTYGDKKNNLIVPPALEEVYRDIKLEYEICTLLEQYFPEKSEDGQNYILPAGDDERLAALVEDGVNQLKNLTEVYISEAFKSIRIANKVKVNTGLSIKGNLLNVSWNIDGMTTDELYDILGAYKRKKKYYRLKNGELLNIKDSGIEAFADIQESLNLTRAELKAGMADVPLYRALYLDSLMKENSDKIHSERDESFEKLIDTFDEKKNENYQLPEGIEAELRPYQMDGYRWAKLLSEMGFGGILADDMGLGKTLQMIAFMKSKTNETHLVICPASLVYNWSAELQRFAPDMKVCMMVGNVSERRELIEKYQEYDVVVTSYDLLKRDIEMYVGKNFDCQIIDEAQNIKNPSTQVAKAVKSINSRTRFALTGTPIENRLSELWSIFEYLMPGYLYSYKHFKETFEEKIISDAEKDNDNSIARLHAMISPFLLRRLKKDVLKELPDKIEKIVYSGFGQEQDKLYRAVEKNMIMSLQKKTDSEFNESKLLILAELTKLRQICCDPSLLYENYTNGSAKLDTCIELIESAVEGGHKILLFSQFATMLKILEENLTHRKIRTMTITGSTSKVKRRQLVDEFQAGGADVFLISLKAGGTGLNLTAADMVIHYDPWWNVAAQNQATDRAHRIGQENNVTVVKLIAKDTIEERILKLQDKKKDLADKIISEEGVGLSALSKEELLGLFGESSKKFY